MHLSFIQPCSREGVLYDWGAIFWRIEGGSHDVGARFFGIQGFLIIESGLTRGYRPIAHKLLPW